MTCSLLATVVLHLDNNSDQNNRPSPKYIEFKEHEIITRETMVDRTIPPSQRPDRFRDFFKLFRFFRNQSDDEVEKNTNVAGRDPTL